MNLKKKLEFKLKYYFKYFSNKDLEKLEGIFSDDVQLIDWTATVKKKKNVLNFNKKIFQRFKKIRVRLVEKFFNDKNNSFACMISIKLDSKSINVVDVIYFNSKSQIKKIVAYLR